MGKKVNEVMTPQPATLQSTDSCAQAAQLMRDKDVGALIVIDQEKVCGIVTDRDIVVRCIAEGQDPKTTALARVCSKDLTELSPEDDVHNAVEIMKKKAIRRIPVVDGGGKPVGIVSLGDLAQAEDPGSALGGISQAPPNR